ncbi:hypothetical protein P3W85_14470 [Cupriavidus basilensis]|uniref:Uncharacterized protein n=1 Tax=Cupriavidus basilensis TaxID=68895 RepID=A0ABT6ANJ6_9BURK|nr:hypothetical protein [Cupriavidus basilensis]MDF3834152.1 hypothetical protein [Cupriavidus basilensis]
MRYLSLWLVVFALPIQNVGAVATLSCDELTVLRQGSALFATLTTIHAAGKASADETDAHCDTKSHHCPATEERGKARDCYACSACSAALAPAIFVFSATQALSTNDMLPASLLSIFASTTPETLLRPPSRHL